MSLDHPYEPCPGCDFCREGCHHRNDRGIACCREPEAHPPEPDWRSRALAAEAMLEWLL